MTDNHLRTTDNHHTEYELRSRARALRRQLFEQADPSAQQQLLDELEAVETGLSNLDQGRSTNSDLQSLEDKPVGGQIIDTTEKCTQSPAHEVRGATSTGLEARAVLRMAQVPTSVYHLFNRADNPLVTCTVRNAGENIRRLRISSFLEGYSGRAVDTVEIDANETATVNQLPALFHARIRRLNELTVAGVNVLIEDLDGKIELNRSEAVPLLARTTAPLSVRDPATGRWTDVAKYFGAFVTPNAPAIMAFLRVVADKLPTPRLTGYLGDEGDVKSQVEAIFTALKDAGIVYVNSVVAFSPDEGMTTQRVRLPRETLKDREANCIDGTVLVASLMEAFSLNPAIVTVPGHTFVGWETRPGSNTWSYLETMMINTNTFAEACASAQKTADFFKSLATKISEPSTFQQWSLSDLRTAHGITPME